jgi:hypothetical protein
LMTASVGRLGGFGLDLAVDTGFLQNSHVTRRMSPRKRLGVFNPVKLILDKFADP